MVRAAQGVQVDRQPDGSAASLSATLLATPRHGLRYESVTLVADDSAHQSERGVLGKIVQWLAGHVFDQIQSQECTSCT